MQKREPKRVLALVADLLFTVKIADAAKAKIQPLSKDDVAAWRKAMEPVWKKFEADIGNDLIQAALKSNP